MPNMLTLIAESIQTTITDSQQHLNEINMSYWRHACRSVAIAASFTACALRATIHAIVPGLYITASTDAIEDDLKEVLRTA